MSLKIQSETVDGVVRAVVQFQLLGDRGYRKYLGKSTFTRDAEFAVRVPASNGSTPIGKR
jgi:hypothetical protein